MPIKSDIKTGAIPRTRCDIRLQEETKVCAYEAKMDLAEYIRSAVREKNERVRIK